MNTRKTFETLDLDNWEINPTYNPRPNKSGQADVLFLKNREGKEGVFRLLKNKSEKAKERFKRELKILTNDEYKNPSIVNILEHPQNNNEYWYISEKGEQCDIYIDNLFSATLPSEYSLKCIGHIKELAQGLTKLHKNGIYHRDIKPKNIVVILDRLVLIDFGLAYVNMEERLSSIDEATGNQRYSHDKQLYYLENPSPWYDVFMLSQVLIWMLKSKKGKKWSRPLHWRFVDYPPGYGGSIVHRVRALTAVCSEESVSPQNAEQLSSLIDELFPELVEDKHEKVLEATQFNPQVLLAEASAQKEIQKAHDREILSSAFEVVRVYYEQLLDETLDFIFSIKKKYPALVHEKNAQKEAFSNYQSELLMDLNSSEHTLLEFGFGPIESQFYFRINCSVRIPSLEEHYPTKKYPKGALPYCFYLQRYKNGSRIAFPHQTCILVFFKNGTISICTEHFEDIENNVNMDRIKELIKEMIEHNESWSKTTLDR